MKKLLDWLNSRPIILKVIECAGWILVGFGIGYGVGSLFV